MVGVAVNVTLCPLQILVPPLAAILTEGATDEFTVILTPLEVAVVGLAHDELEVSTQVITSPLTKLVVE